MPCETDRPLTQAEREAAFNQQRTGVQRGVRPFTQDATPENIAEYLNREVFPVLKQARDKINETYLQATDNAPSGNPLGYYFSTETANADPTSGFIRLDNATQDTATTIRVSQTNGRVVDVTPWLDVMSGSATSPLGVVTLTHAINPGRFIRFDLTSMTDQGAYWDLTVSAVESSHDNPFVQGDQIAIGFIAGVSSGTTTVAPGAAAALAGDGLVYDAVNAELDVGAGDGIDVAADSIAVDVTDIVDNVTITEVATNNIQRAALTGFAEAAAGSNATTSAEPIVTYSASANMSAERVLTSGTNTAVDVSVANQIRVNVDDFPLTGLADQAAETFLGNFTAGSAPPTARAGSSVAGAGLTYTAGGTMAVGAGTRITVNANDVQLAAGAAESFLMNATSGSAVADYRAGSSVAGAGLTYTAGGTLAVGAGTGITVNANDVQLSTIANLTALANKSGSAAAPSATALETLLQSLTASVTISTSGSITMSTSGAGTDVTINPLDDLVLQTNSTTRVRINAGGDWDFENGLDFDVTGAGTIDTTTGLTLHDASGGGGVSILGNGGVTLNAAADAGDGPVTIIAGATSSLIAQGGTLDCSFDSISLDAGTGACTVSADDGLVVGGGGVGAIHLADETGAPTALANHGTLYFPTGSEMLVVMGDSGNTWRQNMSGMGRMTAITTRTNSTSVLDGASFTSEANSIGAGNVLHFGGMLNGTRGATNTASNVVFRITVAGTSRANANLATTQVNGANFTCWVEGYVTCITAGSSGTAIAVIRFSALNNATTTVAGSTGIATFTLNTTTTNTFALSAEFSAAVADLSMTWQSAVITRHYA